MNNFIKKEICTALDCVGCGVCVSVCPQRCISMEENKEGFLYPVIDIEKCINCGLCEKKCPQNMAHNTETSKFYMAWHKNREILMKSSSGGVFSALANWILDRDGIIVGATFNSKTREVSHELINEYRQLDELRLSKYYQSKTEHIFPLVREQIKQGKLVLFTGTACQIAALNSFLGKLDIKNLITIDVL